MSEEESKKEEAPRPLSPILEELKKVVGAVVAEEKAVPAPTPIPEPTKDATPPKPDWSKFKGVRVSFWQSVKTSIIKICGARFWHQIWNMLEEVVCSRFMLLLVIAGLAGMSMGMDYAEGKLGSFIIHAIIFLCSLRCLWILYMNRPENKLGNMVKGGTTYQRE
jgi:hypothetical protein